MAQISQHVVVLCILLVAHATNGARWHHSNQEKIGSVSAVQDLPHVQSVPHQTSKGQALPLADTDDRGVYYARHETPNNNYYGVIATMDLYGFTLSPAQVSAAVIWVINDGNGTLADYNEILVGWHVFPDLYGDSKTHFFTYWTRDNEQNTGCYNMECPGFKLISGSSITPGDVIDPVSHVNGSKQNMTIKVNKDRATGDWLVYCGLNAAPKLVGLFPKTLFTGLADKSGYIRLGGGVRTDIQISPPMGNGLFPDSNSAASFSNIQYVDENGQSSGIAGDLPIASNNNCFRVTPIVEGKFFYGGPGGDCGIQ